MAAKHWIQKSGINKPGHKGRLHRALGIPEGTKIPETMLEAAAKKKGRIGREARMAENMRHMRH